jgi:hypothetical protein
MESETNETGTAGATGNKRSGSDRRKSPRSAADRRRLRNRIGTAVLVVLLGGAATVYGCNSDRITGPAATPPSRAVPTAPNADVLGATTTTETALPGEETNLCNGELVPYRGKVSYGFFTTPSDALHQRVKFSYVFDGTGDLGNVYHGASEYAEEFNVSTNGAVENFNHETRMTSPTAPDMKLHYVAHVRLTADGTIDASFEKAPPIDCGK